MTLDKRSRSCATMIVSNVHKHPLADSEEAHETVLDDLESQVFLVAVVSTQANVEQKSESSNAYKVCMCSQYDSTCLSLMSLHIQDMSTSESLKHSQHHSAYQALWPLLMEC